MALVTFAFHQRCEKVVTMFLLFVCGVHTAEIKNGSVCSLENKTTDSFITTFYLEMELLFQLCATVHVCKQLLKFELF